MKPEGGREQGRRHTDHQDDGRLLAGDTGHGHQHRRVDNALADGIGDLGADQDRTGELADAGGNDRVADGYRLGSHCVGHGVCHIVGTDVPCHVQTEEGRQTDDIEVHFFLLWQLCNVRGRQPCRMHLITGLTTCCFHVLKTVNRHACSVSVQACRLAAGPPCAGPGDRAETGCLLSFFYHDPEIVTGVLGLVGDGAEHDHHLLVKEDIEQVLFSFQGIDRAGQLP